jgi:hypothetical protein
MYRRREWARRESRERAAAAAARERELASRRSRAPRARRLWRRRAARENASGPLELKESCARRREAVVGEEGRAEGIEEKRL